MNFASKSLSISSLTIKEYLGFIQYCLYLAGAAFFQYDFVLVYFKRDSSQVFISPCKDFDVPFKKLCQYCHFVCFNDLRNFFSS